MRCGEIEPFLNPKTVEALDNFNPNWREMTPEELDMQIAAVIDGVFAAMMEDDDPGTK